MNRREMITFTFSNRDIEVCRCLVLAAHSAGVLQELFSDAEIEGKIGADELRQLKPFIDLFLLVSTNNTEAVERMRYGHVHNTHDEALVNRFIQETRQTKVMSRYSTAPKPIPCNMINCFCMFGDYKPLTLDEWIEVDDKRRAIIKEVHQQC